MQAIGVENSHYTLPCTLPHTLLHTLSLTLTSTNIIALAMQFFGLSLCVDALLDILNSTQINYEYLSGQEETVVQKSKKWLT